MVGDEKEVGRLGNFIDGRTTTETQLQAPSTDDRVQSKSQSKSESESKSESVPSDDDEVVKAPSRSTQCMTEESSWLWLLCLMMAEEIHNKVLESLMFDSFPPKNAAKKE